MARDFVSASSHHIVLADESSFDFARLDPFSIAFIDSHDIDQFQVVISKMEEDSPNIGWTISMVNNLYLFNHRVDATNEIDVRTDNSFSTGVERSVIVTYDGSGDAAGASIYVEGTDEAVSTFADNLTTDPLNNIDAQISGRSGANVNYDGRISEVAIWDRELSSGEAISITGARLSPLFYPNGLISYLPLMGRTSPEIDVVGGHNGTITGATTAVHHRVIYPGDPFIISLVAAVAGIEIFRRRIEGY